jgi:hypothetical protein
MRLAGPPWLFTLLFAAACTHGMPAGGGEPLSDPTAVAEELSRATLPDTLLHVTFGWSYADADVRLRGRGVARVQAPERLRLDLFGPQGESYLAAALVGERFRAPAAVGRVELPSPALLWGALGVLHVPPGAQIRDGSREGGVIVLRAESGGDTYQYRVLEAGPQLLEVSRLHRGRALESVLLSWEGGPRPTGARYRHQAEFRELNLEIEEIRPSLPFAESIWYPDAE